jgi:hypothetical protein
MTGFLLDLRGPVIMFYVRSKTIARLLRRFFGLLDDFGHGGFQCDGCCGPGGADSDAEQEAAAAEIGVRRSWFPGCGLCGQILNVDAARHGYLRKAAISLFDGEGFSFEP